MFAALKMMFGKHAPTHHAEKYWPSHDGTLNLVEARRGRGKSFGATRIMLEWLKQRWAAITSGAAPFARIYSNIRFNLRRVAHCLIEMRVTRSLQQALDTLARVVVYVTSWDQLLTSYDSLVLIDEANRNLNAYDIRTKDVAGHEKVVHDWLQQTRKHKLTIWFFVQDVEWLKAVVLSLCDRLWRAKRVRKKGTQEVRYFPWYGGDPFAKGKGQALSRSADFKMRFDFDLNTARCYDTLQAVETLDQHTQFRSFGEISDYMLQHGLKPVGVEEKPDFATWDQECAWFASAAWLSVLVQVQQVYPSASASVPPEVTTGGGGGAGEVAAYVAAQSADAAHDTSRPSKPPRVHRVRREGLL